MELNFFTYFLSPLIAYLHIEIYGIRFIRISKDLMVGLSDDSLIRVKSVKGPDIIIIAYFKVYHCMYSML